MVDDDPDHHFLMAHAFQKAGMGQRIRSFAHVSEVIAYLEAQSIDPGAATVCLITDIRMPDMNGFELLRCLKANPDHAVIPAIVMSGSDEINDVEEAYRLGASSYLKKPVDFGDLERMVAKLIDYWGMCEVPPKAAG